MVQFKFIMITFWKKFYSFQHQDTCSLDMKVDYYYRCIANTSYTKFFGVTIGNMLYWKSHIDQILPKLTAAFPYNNLTRCINFSKFILEGNSTCFGQFLCPSSGVIHCKQQWYMSYRFADCLQAVSKPVWHITLVCGQWITPDVGQRNCLKHVEFPSKINSEKLVHLVGLL
jgi:hypothetical protein